MRIGFDLDKVFINYPPFVPKNLIDWLYRNNSSKSLSYRIPNKLEQIFRRITHHHLFRPKISENIDYLHSLKREPYNHQLHLISSRYKFLEQLTYNLLKRYNLVKPFSSINLNLNNQQPHLFKKTMIKKLLIQVFVDDDIDLLEYLKKECPNAKLLWYNPNHKKIKTTIKTINSLNQITEFLK